MTTRKWTWLFVALLATACSRTGHLTAGGSGGAHGGTGGKTTVGTGGSGTSAMGGDSAAGTGGAAAGTGGAAAGTGGIGTGGAAASGGVTSHGGAPGGSSPSDAATGGAVGSGGIPGALEPCNSSDGSGCGDAGFCMDTRSDSCSPDYMKDCTGLCAGRRRAVSCGGPASAPCPDGFVCLPDARTYLGPDPVSVCVGANTRECTSNGECSTGFSCVPSAGGGRCSPDKTVCEDYVTCKMAPPPRCPRGYARSTPDQCYGPCVPVELCGCSTDTQCGFVGATCDRKQGRCALASSPEPRCQLPFDLGPCDNLKGEYAFIDGECQPATGGCGGNDNRFSSLEECRARCQGVPGETACPAGRVERAFCIGCGTGGGCIRYIDVCTTTCATQTDCPSSDLACSGGYCEKAVFCL